MERKEIERLIQIIAVESAEMLEQVQWESVEPKAEKILSHLEVLDARIKDLRRILG